VTEHGARARVKDGGGQITLSCLGEVADCVDAPEDTVQVTLDQPVLNGPIVDPEVAELCSTDAAELAPSDACHPNFGVLHEDLSGGFIRSSQHDGGSC
jgi:hypothetical protein